MKSMIHVIIFRTCETGVFCCLSSLQALRSNGFKLDWLDLPASTCSNMTTSTQQNMSWGGYAFCPGVLCRCSSSFSVQYCDCSVMTIDYWQRDSFTVWNLNWSEMYKSKSYNRPRLQLRVPVNTSAQPNIKLPLVWHIMCNDSYAVSKNGCKMQVNNWSPSAVYKKCVQSKVLLTAIGPAKVTDCVTSASPGEPADECGTLGAGNLELSLPVFRCIHFLGVGMSNMFVRIASGF